MVRSDCKCYGSVTTSAGDVSEGEVPRQARYNSRRDTSSGDDPAQGIYARGRAGKLAAAIYAREDELGAARSRGREDELGNLGGEHLNSKKEKEEEM